MEEFFRRDTGDEGMGRGASREAQDRGSWVDSDWSRPVYTLPGVCLSDKGFVTRS